jgi:formylglycine-generating enzyme required for sulfatase activity
MDKIVARLFTAFLFLVTCGAALSAATVDVDLQSSPDGSTWSSAVAGLVAVDSSPLYYRATVTPTGGTESVSNTILVDRAAGNPAHVRLESSGELAAWAMDLAGSKDITASKEFFRVKEDDTFTELVTVTGNGTTIADFQIGRFEVTREIWIDVQNWAENTSPNAYDFSTNAGGLCVELTHPASSLNWFDAMKWCNARSEKEGLQPVYFTDALFTTPYRTGDLVPSLLFTDSSADGYRLPSLDEWFHAATGGQISQGYQYSGSDTIDDVARYDGNSTGSECPFNEVNTSGTWPCGSLLPNELDLYDMSGNVLEWVADGPIDPETELPDDTNRYAQGGCFVLPSTFHQTNFLFLAPIGSEAALYGVRVARNVPPPASAIAPETLSKARKGGKKADFSRSGGSSKKAQ